MGHGERAGRVASLQREAQRGGMSFRTRLTVFFVLIVVVPMVALGVVVARLVTDSEEGKANARAGAHVTAALAVYERASERGGLFARQLGADPVLSGAIREGDRVLARTRLRTLMRQQGLARGGGRGGRAARPSSRSATPPRSPPAPRPSEAAPRSGRRGWRRSRPPRSRRTTSCG